MAVSTRSGRASSVGLLALWMLAPPAPDGGISQADRQHIAATYSDIPPLETASVAQQRIAPRTPMSLVVLEMDFCSRTFGVPPCLAAGEPCYSTYPTCKYKAAYVNVGRLYKFTTADAPASLDGARPYVKSVRLLPTEIRDRYTVAGRVTVEMYDEPDGDVGVDPYVTSRAAFPRIPGTYWRKWLVRNVNYKGRRIKVYEGLAGMAEAEFDLRWTGKLETIRAEGNTVKIDAADLLKDISRLEIPPKIDCKLRANIGTTTTTLYVTTGVAQLPQAGGTIRIGDEILSYAGYNPETGEMTGVVRAQWGTTAEEASAGAKIQICRVFPKGNPFDLMKSILIDDAGMAASDVDTAAFDLWRDYPARDLDVGPCVVSEPMKASELLGELLDLVNAKMWQSEANRITICRDLGSLPATRIRTISDADSILARSVRLDANEQSRLTRVWLYWDRASVGREDDIATYRRVDVAISPEAEASISYGEIIERKIRSRFLVAAGQVEEEVAEFARNVCMRALMRHIEASPIIMASLDLKDADLRTGDFVDLRTDELPTALGAASTHPYQVVRREKTAGAVKLSFLRCPSRRIGHVAANSQASYLLATAAERDKYAFVAGNDGLMSNYDSGYGVY